MKKKGKTNPIRDAMKVARKASREAELASGIRPRAQTYADRTKVASKRACRGRVAW